jgi:hypothetical protein
LFSGFSFFTSVPVGGQMGSAVAGPTQQRRRSFRPELQGANRSNRSDFDMFAVIALEGVEIATRLLSLNPEQAHFQPASWAQEQGLGVRFFCCWHPASFVIRTA